MQSSGAGGREEGLGVPLTAHKAHSEHSVPLMCTYVPLICTKYHVSHVLMSMSHACPHHSDRATAASCKVSVCRPVDVRMCMCVVAGPHRLTDTKPRREAGG